MFKIVRSKRGISPILATLLLIVIAVAAVIVTYAWVLTFTTTQTQQAGVLLTKENVSWPNSTRISVVIRNTGTSNGKITAVYIGTSSTNLASISSNDVSPAPGSASATVNAESSTMFTITYSWASNTRYYFKFATDTPATLEFSEKSP